MIFFRSIVSERLADAERRLLEMRREMDVLRHRFTVAEGNLVSNGVNCQTVDHPASTVRHSSGFISSTSAYTEQPRCGLLEAFAALMKHLRVEIVNPVADTTGVRVVKLAK